MRSPSAQQWAGIIIVGLGFAWFSIGLGLIIFGILVLLAGISRELEQKE